MNRIIRFALPALMAGSGLFASRVASAAPVTWTSWTAGNAGAGTASGTITIGGTVINVAYTGQATFIQVNDTGSNYWIPSTPYTSTLVDNPPTRKDIIALSLAGTRTLTFSEPVKNLFFAVVSLNGNSYRFNRDFEVVSFGAGFWGTGTLARVDNGDGTFSVSGTGEPHGVIRFKGSVTDITWTAGAENWNGFTVGTYGLGDEDDDNVPDKNEYGGGGIMAPRDSDNDGTPDYKDTDDDGDGIPTSVEVPGGTVVDSDGDGVPNYRDGDSDNDGVSDSVEVGADVNNPVDSDGDGVPDYRDLDSDNDGIPDLWENGKKALDVNLDGRIDTATDADGDGVLAAVDTDDTMSKVVTSNVTLINSDNDTKPNYIDTDSDEDGVADILEIGGTDANSDGRVDGFTDANGNGLHDAFDSTQGGTAISLINSDTDTKADYVDTDSDNDCVLDSNVAEVGAARINAALPNASVDLNCGVLGSGNICDVSQGVCTTGCKVDNDCASTQFCTPGNGSIGVCKTKANNGDAIPGDAPGNGVCAVGTVAKVCVSGACETSDNKCGLVNGSACTASSQCRTSTCTDNFCGGIPASDAGTTDGGSVVVTDGGVVADAGADADAAAQSDASVGKADSGAGTIAPAPSLDNLEGGGCACSSTESPSSSLLGIGLGVVGFAAIRRRRDKK